MSKRANSNNGSPKKKMKVDHGQKRLDAFFTQDNSRSSPGPSGPARPSRAPSGSAAIPDPSSPIASQPQVRMKKPRSNGEPGSTLSSTARGHIKSTPNAKPSKPQIVEGAQPGHPLRLEQPVPHEIIDVDALDDDGPPSERSSGPSSPGKVSVNKVEPSMLVSATAIAPLASYPDLGVDPPSFDISAVPLANDKAIPYSFLAHTLSTLSTTRSRIIITNSLTNALRTVCAVHEASLIPSLYLLSNSISPPYLSLELGLGHSIISKAIQNVSGLTPAALKRLYNQKGDPGDVAFEAKANVRTLLPHAPLLIVGVYQSLLKIATAKGEGSVKHKQSIVEKLLVSAKGEEIRFLVRTLAQHIRVGAVRTTILTALARAMALTPPRAVKVRQRPFYASPTLLTRVANAESTKGKKDVDTSRVELEAIYDAAEGLVKKVFVQHPSYDDIVVGLLAKGLDGLAESVPLTLGQISLLGSAHAIQYF